MKKGFTLAEVLITLGIIGVVAALTAPALVKNTGSAKIGPSLAKFVNTFETATEQFMNDENVDKLSEAVSSSFDLAEKLSEYMIMTPLKNHTIRDHYYYTAYAPNGTGLMGDSVATCIYQSKDGFLVLFTSGTAYEAKPPYKGGKLKVYVDIGGGKAGKSLFGFYVDDSGVLIPIGSNAEKYVKGEKTACSPTGSTLDSGLGCTGVIADNGWKADY